MIHRQSKIYWFCCLHGFHDDARKAALASLGHEIAAETYEEMNVVPAIFYHRLIDYRRRCYSVLRDLRKEGVKSWIAQADVFEGFHEDQRSCSMHFEFQHEYGMDEFGEEVILGTVYWPKWANVFIDCVLAVPEDYCGAPSLFEASYIADFIDKRVDKTANCRFNTCSGLSNLSNTLRLLPEFAKCCVAPRVQKVLEEVSEWLHR